MIPKTNNRKRIAVLISGRGSNMASLIEACEGEDYPASVVKVLSDQASAAGLETAKHQGIDTTVVERKDFDTRQSHERAIADVLENCKPDLICLAGYMRILSGVFIERFAGKILNIHPSLLPLFKGLDTHQRALAAGVRVHGCSVHVVTATLDDGPIIAQAAVPVLPSDTPEILAARVLKTEHKLYPAAIAKVARSEIQIHSTGVSFVPTDLSDDPDRAVFSL